MKQTNNALKFLLAQYRSILKQATLASFLTAAAIVAATPASAGDITNDGANTGDLKWEDITGSVTVDGSGSDANTYEKITISDNATNTNSIVVNITGDKNTISSGNTTADLGTININAAGDAADTKLDITGGASLSVKTFNLTKGTLTLGTAGTDAGTLSAKTINIGGENGSVDADGSGEAIVVLNSGSALGKAVAAPSTSLTLALSDLTTLNIGTGANITANKPGTAAADHDAVTINAAVLNMTDGSLTVDGEAAAAGSTDTKSTDLTVNLVSGSITGGTTTVNETSKLAFAFVKDNPGSTAGTNYEIVDANGNKVTRTLNIGAEASLVGKGSVEFSGEGTVTIDAGAVNKETADESLTGGLTFGAGITLSTTAENLKGLGTNNAVTISGTATNTSGVASLSLTDSSNIDLANNTYFKLGDTATKLTPADDTTGTTEVPPTLKVGSNTNIEGTSLTISAPLSLTNAINQVKATNLTLGSSKYDGSTNLKVSEVVAEHIDHLTSGSVFTISSTKETLAKIDTITNPYDTTNSAFKYAGNGTISDNLKISGASTSLTIAAGNYTDSKSLELASGSLTIGNQATGTDYEGIDTSLTLTGDVKLTNSAANTITIAGNSGSVTFVKSGNGVTEISRDPTATLDLTGANLTISGGSALTTINVNGQGELLVTSKQINEILNVAGNRTGNTASGAGILVSGGAITVNGALSGLSNNGLDYTKLQSKDTVDSDKISFHTSNGGELSAKTIFLSNSEAATGTAPSADAVPEIKIGAKGVLSADTIILDNASTNNTTKKPGDVKLTSGVLNVGTNLTSNNLKGGNAIVLAGTAASGSVINLGSVDYEDDQYGISTKYSDAPVVSTTAATGSVDVDLELKGTTAQNAAVVNVNYGDWTAKNITLTSSGALVIGTSGGAYNATDDNGKYLYTASLTGKKLTVTDDKSTVTINERGAATFDELAQEASAGAITLENGSLTINGKYVAKGETLSDGSKATADSYGVKTSNITASGRNAMLTFGADAAKAITISNDGKKVTAASGTFGTGSLTVEEYATVKLDFASGIAFDSTSSLKELRKLLFKDNTDGSALNDGYINLGSATVNGLPGVENGTIDWTKLKEVKDITDILIEGQLNATLINIDGSEVVNANVGNIRLDNNLSTVKLGDAYLGNANAGLGSGNGNFVFNANDPTKAGNATIQAGGHVTLANGGNIGTVTLTAGNSGVNGETILNIVASGNAATNISEIDAGENTQININGVTNIASNLDANDLVVDRALNVNNGQGTINLSGDLTSTIADNSFDPVTTGSITTKTLNVEGTTNYGGSLKVTDKATFGDETNLWGNNEFASVTFKDAAKLSQGTTTAGTIEFTEQSDSFDVVLGASLTAGAIDVATDTPANFTLVAGNDVYENETTGEKRDSASGYITLGRLNLNGGTVIADPAWDKPYSVVAVGQFGSATAVGNLAATDAGTLNGRALALQNSILAIGVTDSAEDTVREQLASIFSDYIDSDGSLNATQADGSSSVGSIAYVAKTLKLNATDKLIVDAAKSYTSYQQALSESAYSNAITQNALYLGANSSLAVSYDAAVVADKAALTIDSTADAAGTASIYVADNTSKVLLVGDNFTVTDDIKLFAAQDGKGILVNHNDLNVETLNGLMSFTYKVGELTSVGKLQLNEGKVKSFFTDVSAPVRDTLLSYAAQDLEWENSNKTGHITKVLHDEAAPESITTTDGKTFFKDGTQLTADEAKKYVAQAVVSTDAAGNPSTTYDVYYAGSNSYVDKVVRDTVSGMAAESVARLGIFAGGVQVAQNVSKTTSEAISGRFGIGGASSSITYADNAQGTGLWVTPVYKSFSSDSFESQGTDYGADIDLYGLALGGDFTFAEGFRLGAMFNVGSGSADGQGAGTNVNNDFDYYGFALYGGLVSGPLSIIGDVSYAVASQDVDTTTEITKVSTSFDSKALSVGVTAQYALDIEGFALTPHAGIRYTSIDLDDYTVQGEGYGDIAYFDADKVNVFSIPVGVTFAKEFVSGSWTVKPSLDITLTGNFGDDELDANVNWVGYDNLSTALNSEIIDNFTYGGTLGVAAKSGNLSFGLGVNYTGSSNTSEYGVSANARFVF